MRPKLGGGVIAGMAFFNERGEIFYRDTTDSIWPHGKRSRLGKESFRQINFARGDIGGGGSLEGGACIGRRVLRDG